MNTLGTLLLWCVFQVTLVAVATLIGYFLARRGGASLRSSVVLAGLITATLLVPLAWSPWPRWELPRAADDTNEPPPVVNEVVEGSTSTIPADDNIMPIDQPLPSVELEPITWRTTWNNFVESLENPQSPASPVSPDPALPWSQVVLGLFGVALLIGLIRLVGGYWSVRRTIRQARRVRDPQLIEMLDLLRAELSCRTPIELRETHKTATAAASGWRRPVILLPVDWRGWTSEQTRAVLAHELAHVVRRDYLTACVAQILLALHFYHPLWQWLVGRLRLEQELAADALAASVTGGREAYLKNLAALALRRSDASIAWPARAFLPSRHTFLRRVEMLRDPKAAVDRSGWLLRVVSVVGLLVCGIVVAGIRPGAVVADETTSEDKAVSNQPEGDGAVPAGDNQNTGVGISAVSYIPDEALGVLVLHPRKVLTDPRFEEHAAQIKQFYQEVRFPGTDVLRNAGVVPKNMVAAAFGFVFVNEGQGDRGDILVTAAMRFADPIDRSIIEDAAAQTTSAAEPTVYQLSEYLAAAIPNERTLLLTYNAQAAASMMKAAQGNHSKPWARILENLDSPTIAFLGNSEAISALVDKSRELKTGAAQQLDNALAPVQPLLADTTFAGIGLQIGKQTRLLGYAESDDPAAAERVAETLTALVTLAQNTVRQFKQRLAERPGDNKAILETFIPLAEQLFQTAKIDAQDDHVTLTMSAGETSATLAALLPAIQEARQAAYRVQSKNNLKQLGLAFHNYYAKHGYFPPAVIEENGVTRSWRVEILPFLEQKSLYDKYRKDEPWDSEHNKLVLAQMPAVFHDPSDDSDPNSTSYYLLTSEHAVTNSRGPGEVANGLIKTREKEEDARKPLPKADFLTLFTDEPIDLVPFTGKRVPGEAHIDAKGPTMGAITDGTSNTILVVEASRNVPWTKPEDIPVDPEKIVELLKDDLGGNHEGGFLATICDGSVRGFATSIDPETLKELITPSGGEVVNGGTPIPRPDW